MAKYVTLTVDFHKDTSSDHRDKFNAKLQDLEWHKIGKSNALWVAKFKDDAGEQDIINKVQNLAARTARMTNITGYDIAVTVSDEPPAEWSK